MNDDLIKRLRLFADDGICFSRHKGVQEMTTKIVTVDSSHMPLILDEAHTQIEELKIELAAAKARIAGLEKEVKVSDALIAERNRLLNTIPDCPTHGRGCVPHAVEWVTQRIAAGQDSQGEALGTRADINPEINPPVSAATLSDEQIERGVKAVSDLGPATVMAVRLIADQAKEANRLRVELATTKVKWSKLADIVTIQLKERDELRRILSEKDSQK